MQDIFGIDKSCWGRKNVNPIIHPELNQSVQVTKALIGNRAKTTKKRGKYFDDKKGNMKHGNETKKYRRKHQQKQKFIYQPNPAQHEPNT